MIHEFSVCTFFFPSCYVVLGTDIIMHCVESYKMYKLSLFSFYYLFISLLLILSGHMRSRFQNGCAETSRCGACVGVEDAFFAVEKAFLLHISNPTKVGEMKAVGSLLLCAIILVRLFS